MLLRVSRTRSTNTTLLLVASTNVRVEQLNKKVQLLIRLVKENGGEFQTKKKKKKKDLSKIKLDDNVSYLTIKQQSQKKQPLTLMSKEDLSDYVEIALSFRMVCKYPSKISINKTFSLRLLLNIVNLFNIFVMQRNQMDKHLLQIPLYSYPFQLMLLMN